MSYKKWAGKLAAAAMLCFMISPAWAAPAPITLEANYLQYNDDTGEILATGNVRLNRELTKIQSEHITGNVNSGDVFADGQVTWMEENKTLTGEKLNYNYKTKTGKMSDSKGNYEGILIGAQTAEIYPDKSIIRKGSITKCPAQIPDYRITAEKIEVYPGDKVVMYKATLWIKNTKLYSMPKFTKSLKDDNQVSLLPRIGYHSHDGFFIGQHLEYQLQNNLYATADLLYYHERGFEPQYGLINRGKHAETSLIAGSQFNGDHEWWERRPELVYDHMAFRLGKLPWNVKYKLYMGKIFEETSDTELWRSGGAVYIDHTPVKLSSNTTLNYGGGYEHTWYESHDKRTVLRGHVGVTTEVNDRLSIGLGYYHAAQYGETPFVYDNIDVKDEWRSGFTYKIDRLWKVGIDTSYDLNRDEMHDVDYTLTRNLHCFEAAITYRQKRDEWRVKLGVINW